VPYSLSDLQAATPYNSNQVASKTIKSNQIKNSMKRIVKFCSLFLLLPFSAFAGLGNEAKNFLESTKQLADTMRRQAEDEERSTSCFELFNRPSLRTSLLNYDSDHSIEHVFCGILAKLDESYCTRMLVRVLEKAFSVRSSDTNLAKMKRQLRMMFMPHENHLAYVLLKANRILHSPEQYSFSSVVREMFAQYQNQFPLQFREL
jgi:hypothetical protein